MTEIWVKVNPDQNNFKIRKNTYLEVDLTEKAENSRANNELVTELERRLGEKPGIISGHKSSRKKIKVEMEKNEVFEELGVKNG